MKKIIITIALFLSTLITFATFNTSTCLAASSELEQMSDIVPPGEGKTYDVFGEFMTVKTTGEDTSATFTVVEVTTPVGGMPPLHRHSTQETFYILDGDYEFYVGQPTETIKAPPGTSLFFKPGLAHGYKNLGTTPGHYLLMLNPAGFDKLFAEIGIPVADKDKATSSGPPNVETLKKIVSIAGKYDVEFLGLPGQEES